MPKPNNYLSLQYCDHNTSCPVGHVCMGTFTALPYSYISGTIRGNLGRSESPDSFQFLGSIGDFGNAGTFF
jgi:hypothetical protein